MGNREHSCSEASMVLLCRTAGFGEPEGAYIQKSSKALFYSTLLLVFLAFVHAMKNKIKEKLKIWLYLQVSFKPDSSTNKKLKFKFQSLF